MSTEISVAMAAYNGEKYIIRQLESILDQTRKVHEIVIFDDCSTDNTKAVIDKFICENKLQDIIDFRVNDKNLGYASNFMRAIDKSRGDYIFFCDQDDIWTENRVEKMLSVMEENPKIGLLGSEFLPFKSSIDAPKVPGWELSKFKNDGSIEKLEFNSESIFIGCQGCTMVIRRSFFEEIRPFWYEGWAHDEFAWKLALSMDKLFFYHEITLKRRLHSDNVTLHKEHKKEQRLKYLKDLKKSHEMTLEFIKEKCHSDTKEYRIKLMKRHIRATDLRIELIEDKKPVNSLKMLFYTDCYHKKRSIPVELIMALR